MLNRRITRTIYNTTESTYQTQSPNADTLAVVMTAADALYLGYHGRFASRYIQIGTANSATAALTVSYWNGTAWTAVDDMVDQTSAGGATFAQSGFISWDNKTDWVKKSQTGIDTDTELYWVRLTVSGTLSAGTTLQSVLNIYSDDGLLRAYYPELVSDASYLPASRTNLLEQHIAAKDLVVLRCKQRKLIDDESQIIDINRVAVAAVHATAWLILNPIATADAVKDLAGRALDQFNAEIGSLSLDTDQNKDGIVSETERKESMSSISVVRR